MTLTPERLAELRKIAEAATPGPWTREKPGKTDDGFAMGVAIAATYGRQMIYANPPGGSYPSNDAAHIAAFDPQTVLALIDALEAERAKIEEMREALDKIFSRVSYVNIHGVGAQPPSTGEPQLVRVPPQEFWRLFQEIGTIASVALAKGEAKL